MVAGSAGARLAARGTALSETPGTGSILVVDDDRVNRTLLARTLERSGHTVTTAENGLEALRVLADAVPDVVLLDVVMPELDGMSVLERMKDDAALRDVPVIMISALDDFDSVVRCIELGAEDYLPKPFDPVLLRARIRAGLDKRRLHELERARVRDVFARFLPESVVDEVLVRANGDPRLGGVRLVGTALFSDLRGFTTFAESTPADVVIDVLNRYFSEMSDAVLDNGGTLVSYLGDGIFAVFGAPIASDDHADRALATAREMVYERLAALQRAGFATRVHGDDFRMGVGIVQRPVHVRQRRIRASARVHRDRRHGQHGVAPAGAHEGAAATGSRLGLDPVAASRWRRARVRGRARGARQAGASEALDTRRWAMIFLAG